MKVLGAGVFLAEELNGFPVPAAWRKATRNMIMATASIDRALLQLPESSVSHEMGLVLGSSSGELETSAEFLSTWSKSKMARPVLFQNSLHNATTGFATIHFKITGPAITMSARATTPEDCVEMAQSLLRESCCQVCIVTLVEAHHTLADWIGESGVAEGACTLILTSTASSLKALGELNGLKDLNYTGTENHKPLVSITESGFFERALEWGASR